METISSVTGRGEGVVGGRGCCDGLEKIVRHWIAAVDAEKGEGEVKEIGGVVPERALRVGRRRCEERVVSWVRRRVLK